MNKTLYSVVNPIVTWILRSPLHGLMSRNTVLLEFKGIKSGRTYTTPVSYHATASHVHVFTDKSNKWWRNLHHGAAVRVTLRGRDLVGKATVLDDGSPSVQAALRAFLLATPRDASHAGVKFDANGQPIASDIVAASESLVFISIRVPHGPEWTSA